MPIDWTFAQRELKGEMNTVIQASLPPMPNVRSTMLVAHDVGKAF
jgi:hypothetical protein